MRRIHQPRAAIARPIGIPYGGSPALKPRTPATTKAAPAQAGNMWVRQPAMPKTIQPKANST